MCTTTCKCHVHCQYGVAGTQRIMRFTEHASHICALTSASHTPQQAYPPVECEDIGEHFEFEARLRHGSNLLDSVGLNCFDSNTVPWCHFPPHNHPWLIPAATQRSTAHISKVYHSKAKHSAAQHHHSATQHSTHNASLQKGDVSSL